MTISNYANDFITLLLIWPISLCSIHEFSWVLKRRCWPWLFWMLWLVTIWNLQRLIDQLNGHMIKSFAYFTKKMNTCHVTATMDGSFSNTIIMSLPFWKKNASYNAVAEAEFTKLTQSVQVLKETSVISNQIKLTMIRFTLI